MTVDLGHTYDYDAEDRVASIDSSSTGYTYDANGLRVRKTSGSYYTEYVYFGSNLIAERDQSGAWTDYVFAGSSRVAKARGVISTADTEFYHADHLGSTRLMTNASGTVIAGSEGTFLPYGEEFSVTTSGNRYKFTGKERDSESSNDYFGARYYSYKSGRFLSPDKVEGPFRSADPQSFKKYAYVFNRPTVLVDPDGQWPGWYHDQIIKDLHGHMGKRVVDALNKASIQVDNDQSAAGAYKHRMRDGRKRADGSPMQTAAQAETASAQYINDNLNKAVEMQLRYETPGYIDWYNLENTGTGYSALALSYYGNALHTVTDGTSPQHRGNQPWSCLMCASAITHSDLEERNARSGEAADAEARYDAHVQGDILWRRFNWMLDEARKKKKQREEPGETK